MATNTSRLGLLKKDTATDGNDTFNIKTMLNDNWDKIDAKVATLGPDGKVPADQVNIPATTASKITVADTADLFTATDVEGVLKELFTNASDGKARIANATGTPSTSSDTFTKIAGDITAGKAKISNAIRSKGGASNGTDSFDVMAAAVSGIVLGKKWVSGTGSSKVTASGNNIYLNLSNLGFSPSLAIVLFYYGEDKRFVSVRIGTISYYFSYKNMYDGYPVGEITSSTIYSNQMIVYNHNVTTSTTYVKDMQWYAFE